MKENTLAPIILVAFILLFAFVVFYISKDSILVSTSIYEEVDENGCIAALGFSWSFDEKECIKIGIIGDSKYQVIDFESCKYAGYPVMESYPERCKTPGGRTFSNGILRNESTWNQDEVKLMRNNQTGEYGCFGCGRKMCIDPLPNMKQYNESENLHCNSDFRLVGGKIEDVNIKIVPIKDNFGSKIVYDNSGEYKIDELREDCNRRKGTFNTCGTICSPKSEFCVFICALTCEGIKS